MKIMKNNERVWLWGIIGFLLGIVVTVFFAANAVNNRMTGMMRMMGIRTEMAQEKKENGMMREQKMGADMSMKEMMEAIEGKTDDDFDKAFIRGMIVHHQGAIDMANVAKKDARHDEIKNLADDIISAQTKEINMMQEWQKNWGY